MESLLIVGVGLVVYFLPALNAMSRKHPSSGGVFLLNLLLGWTLLGWIVAAVWSASGKPGSSDPSPETHVRCPDCRELVLKDARKCKHCGCQLLPQ